MTLSKYHVLSINASIVDIKQRKWTCFVDATYDSGRTTFY